MPGLVSPNLEALKEKIAALEKRPVLADGPALLPQRIGKADPLVLLGAPAGVLHEVSYSCSEKTESAMMASTGPAAAYSLLTGPLAKVPSFPRLLSRSTFIGDASHVHS